MSGKSRSKKSASTSKANPKKSAIRPSVTFFDLPLEDVIVTHVAKHLDVQDVYNFWQCSRKCRPMAEQMLREIEIADMRRIDERCNDAFWMAFLQKSRRLREVTLHRYTMLDKHFFELLNSNPHIEKLDISYSVMMYHGPYEFALENLVSLEMYDASPTEHFILQIAKHSKLRKVDFSWVRSLSFANISEFIEQQTRLKELHLVGLKTNDSPIRDILMIIKTACRDLELLSFDAKRYMVAHNRYYFIGPALSDMVHSPSKLKKIMIYRNFAPATDWIAENMRLGHVKIVFCDA